MAKYLAIIFTNQVTNPPTIHHIISYEDKVYIVVILAF